MNRREVVLCGLAASDGQPYTPVQVQKLFFLIDNMVADEIGGRVFDFQPYHYGPFDSAVYSVIRELEADGLAEISPGGGMTYYRATSTGVLQGRALLAGATPRVANYIREASGFVRRLGFSELVSAIYKAFPEMRENSVFRG